MAFKIEPKVYNLEGFPGLSARQLAEHYTLYVGYVNKYNEIQELLETVDYSKANQTYSDLRSLKVAENFALNGIKLHEAYFENLGLNQPLVIMTLSKPNSAGPVSQPAAGLSSAWI